MSITMNPQTEATLLLGWWNTSLSPVGKQRADARSQQIAEAVVKILIDIEGLDCLALGEVTSEDLRNLKNLSIPLTMVLTGVRCVKAAYSST